ncbi:hypothetical protein AB0K00_17515 [Dactylosporangium sp. NPDC049525]|uniref:hypothetical protein n=1 Tax=Dactylosporangium sp. NPDC049525 TaxID=3154730 RepID=UPI003439AC30
MRRALLAVPLLLAACGSTETPNAATTIAAATSPASSTVAATTSPAAPSPSSTIAAGPKLGTAQPFSSDGSSARLTAFSVRQPTALKAPKPQAAGMEWASADVQVCADVLGPNYDYLYVTNDPWSLVYADGTTATPSSVTYQQFDAPEYPITDRTIKVGRCIRGWVTFTAPAGKKATMVEYQSRDGNVFDWSTE